VRSGIAEGAPTIVARSLDDGNAKVQWPDVPRFHASLRETDPAMCPPAANGDEQGDPTSIHVQRAEAGDAASLEWVVRRFSPVLLAQARFRLGARLRAHVEPEDLVSEVWAIALGRLAALGTGLGRRTPVLLKFLTTTLLHRVNDLVKVEIKGPRGRRAGGDGAAADPLASLSAESRGIVSAVLARERDAALTAALAQLDAQDREVILLRGIEQNSGAVVAQLLQVSEKAVSMRYRRALERLRTLLPGSIFDDLDAE
jgi:RNA polymerase sigma factor (sigma-70 family)